MANNINFGKVYNSSWWGVGVTSNTINWGSSYLDLLYNNITRQYSERVSVDGYTVEALDCVNAATSGFVIEFLLKQDNGFLLQQNGYKIIL